MRLAIVVRSAEQFNSLIDLRIAASRVANVEGNVDRRTDADTFNSHLVHFDVVDRKNEQAVIGK